MALSHHGVLSVRVCVCAPLIAKVDPEKQHLGLSEIVYAKIYWFIIVVHSCDWQIRIGWFQGTSSLNLWLL